MFSTKVECIREAGPSARIMRYHKNKDIKFFWRTHKCNETKEEADQPKDSVVPSDVGRFAHCITDSHLNGPLRFDVDAKAKNDTVATEKQKAVKFAVFCFVRLLVEYIVRNSSASSASRGRECHFALSDASGMRPSSKSGKCGNFKFSYHIVVRVHGMTFDAKASMGICKALNECMSCYRIGFCLKDAPEEETVDLHKYMELMKKQIRAEMVVTEGEIFDEQIYKSNSLRMLGAQRPTGGSELLPVNVDTGDNMKSIWDMPFEERLQLQRMHDPYPSEEEIDSKVVKCDTSSMQQIVCEDDDEADDETECGRMPSVPYNRGHKIPLGICRFSQDERQEFELTCTQMFKMCCSEIRGAKVPEGYRFKVASVGLICGAGVYGTERYYEVYSSQPFCPWKSSRCTTASCSANHNQRRVLMHIHPKGEHNQMYLELRCFSSRCVAAMKGTHRVAIARHPAKGDGPSMKLIGAMLSLQDSFLYLEGQAQARG